MPNPFRALLIAIGLSAAAASVAFATPFDDAKAAAERGDANAQYELGVMYNTGRGVPTDEVEAAKWFAKAAAQGNAPAQFILGSLYTIGSGVPLDIDKGVKLNRQSADQGYMPALMVMGLMYNAGVGTPVDLQQSYMWFTLMAAHVPADDANSRAVADRYLAMLSAKLTPAQIEDAQKAARAWAPIPPK